MTEVEAVIGLECHVELDTQTKMFCGCRAEFGAPPNTNVCPVCLGHPGSLPVPNREAIRRIIRIGLAVGSEIAPHSLFHRKNYFYPDMPKNYQISQYDLPICVGGHLDVDLPDGTTSRIGITRVHMEEDTGKTPHASATGRIHDADSALIDFNRAGVPAGRVRQRARHPLARGGSAPTSVSCAPRWSRSTSATSAWRKARSAATPTSRCDRSGPRPSAPRSRSRT